MDRSKQEKAKNNVSGKTVPSIIIYIAVWISCVLWFWLGMSGGGWVMSYALLSFGVILPVTTLVASFRIEQKQNLGHWRWVAMGFFSLMYVAALWATFALSSFLQAVNITFPSPLTFIIGLCSSAIGIGFGWLVRNKKISLNVPVVGLLCLLSFCYVVLKTLNGSFFRLVLFLDVPAIFLLILGLWFLFRINREKRTDQKQ